MGGAFDEAVENGGPGEESGSGSEHGDAAGIRQGVRAERDDAESFLLVLGDHLYRRGAGTTHACASQLVHAFLEHGEVGKPAIGLKVTFGCVYDGV